MAQACKEATVKKSWTLQSVFLKPLEDFLLIVAPIVLASFAIQWMERMAMINYHSRFGDMGIKLTSFIGTPFHELSHALVALVFGHRINDIQWFNFNMYGVQGYVAHSFDPSNPYQVIGNFFIGFAPIILGSLFIVVLYRFLMPEDFKLLRRALNNSLETFTFSRFVDLFVMVVKSLFNIKRWATIPYWIFVIVSFNIAFHMGPSPADMQGSLSGAVALYILFFLIRLVPIEGLHTAFSKGIQTFQRMMLVTLSVSIVFCVINLAISYLVRA